MQHVRRLLLVAVLAMGFFGSASAQKSRKNVVRDTVSVAFFNGISLQADVVGAVQMATSDHGQWEAALRLNLKDRYFPALELGVGKADESKEYEEKAWYRTKAPFFRIGFDYNILRNKHDIYKAFVGVRYGFSKFKYDTSVAQLVEKPTDNPPLEDETITIADEEAAPETEIIYVEHRNLDATYHWLEGVFGVDAKVWGPLHLGWDVRYRRKLTNKHAAEAEPWYIPGFGNKKDAGFTAMFHIGITL